MRFDQLHPSDRRSLGALAAMAGAAILWPTTEAFFTPKGPLPSVALRSPRDEYPTEVARLLAAGRMDPARASTTALAILPGIGPKLAGRIVRHRERFGLSAAGLGAVRGLGPRRVAALRPWLLRASDGRGPPTKPRPPLPPGGHARDDTGGS